MGGVSGSTPRWNIPRGDLERRPEDLRSHEFRHDGRVALLRAQSSRSQGTDRGDVDVSGGGGIQDRWVIDEGWFRCVRCRLGVG